MKNKEILNIISSINIVSFLLTVLILYTLGIGIQEYYNKIILRLYFISLFIVYSIYCYSKGHIASKIAIKFAVKIESMIKKVFPKFTFEESINDKSDKRNIFYFATYMLLPLVIIVILFFVKIIKLINEYWYYLFTFILLILILYVLNEKIKLLHKIVIISLLFGTIYAFSDLRNNSLSEHIFNLEENYNLFGNYNE